MANSSQPINGNQTLNSTSTSQGKGTSGSTNAPLVIDNFPNNTTCDAIINCNSNGNCSSNGTCLCYQGWFGEYCMEQNLVHIILSYYLN